MSTKQNNSLAADNARIIADILSDPSTPEDLRIKLLNKLLENTRAKNFFESIFNEGLSFGACPNCNHNNHWLIPEEDLNQMGFVTHEADPRVPRMTTAEDCDQWEEACRKKKVSL